MCQVWVRDELQMSDEDRYQFADVDGLQLVNLTSKQVVASKFPSYSPATHAFVALSVKHLIENFENSNDAAKEVLMSQIKAAAEELGLQVRDANDQDKFDTEKLVMGLPPDAGLGIGPFLNYKAGQEALQTQAGRGLEAIIEEIDQNGTVEEQECCKYVLHKEAGSDETRFQNGWKRDCDPLTGEVLECRQVPDPTARGGRRGMRFSDFMAHRIARFCHLTEAEVFSLRYYTTAGFKGINWPLRDQVRRTQRQQHKLSVLVFVLAGAIKKLRAWAADAADAQCPKDLYRGMSNREIFDTFMERGGTELAPMSSTGDLRVALQYSQGPEGTINTLLLLRTENFMDRGVDLEWLSAFPHEKEYLYPPLSYLKPIRRQPIVSKIGSSTYQVVELKIQMS